METGCVIDMSHFRASELDMEVINFARMNGWDGGNNDLDVIATDFISFIKHEVPDNWEGNPTDFGFDFAEHLYYAQQDALEWLNDNCTHDEDHYFTIEDNSLYYWKVDN